MSDFKKRMGMSSEDWNSLMKGKVDLCICRKCPTYRSAIEASIAHYKGLGPPVAVSVHEKAIGIYFCYYDKSPRVHEDKGCICKTCPVTKQAKLVNNLYCMRGEETRQRGIVDPLAEILGQV